MYLHFSFGHDMKRDCLFSLLRQKKTVSEDIFLMIKMSYSKLHNAPLNKHLFTVYYEDNARSSKAAPINTKWKLNTWYLTSCTNIQWHIYNFQLNVKDTRCINMVWSLSDIKYCMKSVCGGAQGSTVSPPLQDPGRPPLHHHVTEFNQRLLCFLSVARIQQHWFIATVAEERLLNPPTLWSWLVQQLVISAESHTDTHTDTHTHTHTHTHCCYPASSNILY